MVFFTMGSSRGEREEGRGEKDLNPPLSLSSQGEWRGMDGGDKRRYVVTHL